MAKARPSPPRSVGREPNLRTDTLGHTYSASIQDIERVCSFYAWAILHHGDAYLPLFDRAERELRHAERGQDVRDRARRMLDAYTLDGGVKAIR